MSHTKQELVNDLKALGVKEGDHLNAKVSLRAIGHVEGGAEIVLEALLESVGESGTVFTDAFINAYKLPLSGEDITKVVRADTASYAGALANTMIRHPNAYRSPHPIQKFVGIGALAEELTQAHTRDRIAYELLGILAERGGKNLKIGDDVLVPGVGTTHVAIERLKISRRRPRMGVMYETEDGSTDLFEIDWAGGCAHAWLKFYPDYEKIGAFLGIGSIGEAPAKLSDMKATLDYDLQAISSDPKVLSCGRASCRPCALDWEFARRNRLIWAIRLARLAGCRLTKMLKFKG